MAKKLHYSCGMAGATFERLTQVRRLASSGEARRLRETADLSLSEIASEVGVDTSTIHRWEKGIRRPNGDAAIKYLKVLDRLATLTRTAA